MTPVITFHLRRYSDNVQIGNYTITHDQLMHWKAIALERESIIRLGALPHGYYDLYPEFQDTPEHTLVFIK